MLSNTKKRRYLQVSPELKRYKLIRFHFQRKVNVQKIKILVKISIDKEVLKIKFNFSVNETIESI